jgi:hypothetical protein
MLRGAMRPTPCCAPRGYAEPLLRWPPMLAPPSAAAVYSRLAHGEAAAMKNASTMGRRGSRIAPGNVLLSGW